MLEGPTSYIGDHPNRKNGKLVEVPRVISNKEDLVIFLDAAYKAEGNASFGFIMKFDNFIVDAGAIQGPIVSSLKEAEAKGNLSSFGKDKETRL